MASKRVKVETTRENGAGRADGRSATTEGTQEVRTNKRPRSAQLAAGGITTVPEFVGVMAAIISDALDQSITPTMANAAANAGGKILTAVAMQLKHGVTVGGSKVLQLTAKKSTRTSNDPIEERRRELVSELAMLEQAEELRK